eukprot:gene5095-128_t
MQPPGHQSGHAFAPGRGRQGYPVGHPHVLPPHQPPAATPQHAGMASLAPQAVHLTASASHQYTQAQHPPLGQPQQWNTHNVRQQQAQQAHQLPAHQLPAHQPQQMSTQQLSASMQRRHLLGQQLSLTAAQQAPLVKHTTQSTVPWPHTAHALAPAASTHGAAPQQSRAGPATDARAPPPVNLGQAPLPGQEHAPPPPPVSLATARIPQWPSEKQQTALAYFRRETSNQNDPAHWASLSEAEKQLVDAYQQRIKDKLGTISENAKEVARSHKQLVDSHQTRRGGAVRQQQPTPAPTERKATTAAAESPVAVEERNTVDENMRQAVTFSSCAFGGPHLLLACRTRVGSDQCHIYDLDTELLRQVWTNATINTHITTVLTSSPGAPPPGSMYAGDQLGNVVMQPHAPSLATWTRAECKVAKLCQHKVTCLSLVAEGSPDGMHLAVGFHSPTRKPDIYLYDVNSIDENNDPNIPHHQCIGHYGTVNCMAGAPPGTPALDAATFVSGGGIMDQPDGSIQVWRHAPQVGAPLHQLTKLDEVHTGGIVSALRVLLIDDTLVTVSVGSGMVAACNVPQGTSTVAGRSKSNKASDPIRVVHSLPGKVVFATAAPNELHLWVAESTDGWQSATLRAQHFPLNIPPVGLYSSGQFFYSVHQNGALIKWSPAKSKIGAGLRVALALQNCHLPFLLKLSHIIRANSGLSDVDDAAILCIDKAVHIFLSGILQQMVEYAKHSEDRPVRQEPVGDNEEVSGLPGATLGALSTNCLLYMPQLRALQSCRTNRFAERESVSQPP